MSQQKQENQEDDTVLLLIFLLVSCLVTKIDERPGELGRWSMENCMDGDGEQERRVKNVGDLDAKLEVEGEANGPSSSSAVSPSSSSAVVFSAGGTGGHIYPSITIANELKITNPNVQIHDSFSNRTRKISFENPKLLYEDSHDAEDAIYYRDGYIFDGYHLRAELAHGGRGNSSSVDHHGSYGDSGSSRAAPKHSDYRVLVTRLPPSASWQDLKDHMRQPGDVLFSQVFCDRGGMTGIVDYAHYDDMKYAVREYDSRQSYSRSHSCDSRQSYSRSPYMSRSPSRSRSYSGRSRRLALNF